MSDTPEALECRKNGGVWYNNECISKEKADLIAQENSCKLNGGIWENGICSPSIVAFDCNDLIDLSPGQFAVGWGDVDDDSKTINVYYKPEGRKERCYKGIKADYPVPIIISGQKPGTSITWHIETIGIWGNKVGYSNEIVTVTKE